MADKPRHRSGYGADETELVRSACLTVAVTLGAFLDDVVIVGGLVPSLLIDSQIPEGTDATDAAHPGTNDLDLGLSLGLLHGQRYTDVSARLRAEGFAPDKSPSGNPTVQRWRRGALTVDFLIPPPPNHETGRRLQNLEPDFGAIVTPGLELAFAERTRVDIVGTTLAGEHATRSVPVCGPGAFVVLKALAFGDRAEPKDAYDMIYVVRGTPGGAAKVAEVLKEHSAAHSDVVHQALSLLERDFVTVDHIGPRRAAEFEYLDSDERDAAAADAHGVVDDLLRAYRSI